MIEMLKYLGLAALFILAFAAICFAAGALIDAVFHPDEEDLDEG